MAASSKNIAMVDLNKIKDLILEASAASNGFVDAKNEYRKSLTHHEKQHELARTGKEKSQSVVIEKQLVEPRNKEEKNLNLNNVALEKVAENHNAKEIEKAKPLAPGKYTQNQHEEEKPFEKTYITRIVNGIIQNIKLRLKDHEEKKEIEDTKKKYEKELKMDELQSNIEKMLVEREKLLAEMDEERRKIHEKEEQMKKENELEKQNMKTEFDEARKAFEEEKKQMTAGFEEQMHQEKLKVKAQLVEATEAFENERNKMKAEFEEQLIAYGDSIKTMIFDGLRQEDAKCDQERDLAMKGIHNLVQDVEKDTQGVYAEVHKEVEKLEKIREELLASKKVDHAVVDSNGGKETALKVVPKVSIIIKKENCGITPERALGTTTSNNNSQDARAAVGQKHLKNKCGVPPQRRFGENTGNNNSQDVRAVVGQTHRQLSSVFVGDARPGNGRRMVANAVALKGKNNKMFIGYKQYNTTTTTTTTTKSRRRQSFTTTKNTVQNAISNPNGYHFPSQEVWE